MDSRFSKKRRLLPIKILTIVFFSLHANYSYCQLSGDLKARLQQVSDTMYNDGDPNYFGVDALCDQLLPPDTWDLLMYENGILTINGKALPAEVNHRYVDKMNRFMAANMRFLPSHFTIKCTGIKLSEVFDKQSAFRKRRVSRGVRPIEGR